VHKEHSNAVSVESVCSVDMLNLKPTIRTRKLETCKGKSVSLRRVTILDLMQQRTRMLTCWQICAVFRKCLSFHSCHFLSARRVNCVRRITFRTA
jgi:hypothetical protein